MLLLEDVIDRCLPCQQVGSHCRAVHSSSLHALTLVASGGLGAADRHIRRLRTQELIQWCAAVEEGTDRWLRPRRFGEQGGTWRPSPSGSTTRPSWSKRLERAIEVNGAFFRFRDLVRGEDLSEEWYAYSTGRMPASAVGQTPQPAAERRRS